MLRYALLLLLAGCTTVIEERPAPELRAKAVQTLCTQDCTIEIHVTEGDDNSEPTPP